MEHIDVIFYINLEHRTDRRAHIEKQIEYLCTDKTKVVRINAIKANPGALGCTLSHIKAYDTFLKNPEWKTALIFEDDFTFHNQSSEINNEKLRKMITTFPDWDVLMLSYNHYCFSGYKTHNPGILKVMSAQTASGYCITKKYAKTLRDNFAEAARGMLQDNTDKSFCCDMYWKRLQPYGDWYTTMPAMGYQAPSYSDIEKKNVNYNC
jgi:glycosyl transferase family 25